MLMTRARIPEVPPGSMKVNKLFQPSLVPAELSRTHLPDLEHFCDAVDAWRHPDRHAIAPLVAKAIVRLQQHTVEDAQDCMSSHV